MGSIAAIPYWHVNVPMTERTMDCPEFLRGMQGKDLRVVSTPDSDYEIQTWDEVCNIVSTNTLERFQRVPSQLRRYKAFSYKLAKRYGTIADFVLTERLKWTEPVVARGAPFQYADDYKILYNDWPYGLDSRIIHLVVWTKFELKAGSVGGDLTGKARDEIESFVTKTFRSKMPQGHVRLSCFACIASEL